MEHVEEFLTRPAPKDPVDIQPACHDLPIICTEPTKEEIRKAIIELKNGKAAGPDDIRAEALKVDFDISMEMLCQHFLMILEKNEVPTEWKKGYLIKLPKRRSQSVFKLQGNNNTGVHHW